MYLHLLASRAAYGCSVYGSGVGADDMLQIDKAFLYFLEEYKSLQHELTALKSHVSSPAGPACGPNAR
jgi:hypothetical protein